MKRGTKFGVITALTVMFTLFGGGAALAAEQPTGDVFLDLFGQASPSCAYTPDNSQTYENSVGKSDIEGTVLGSCGNSVTLKGNLPENTALAVSDAGQNFINAAGTVMDIGEELIWSGDIALASSNAYLPLNGEAQLSIYVGESYNGMPLKLIHLKDGRSLEVVTDIVKNGYVTVNTNSLSPFGIVSNVGGTANTAHPWALAENSSAPSAKPTANAASSETLFPWMTPTPTPDATQSSTSVQQPSQKPQTTAQSSKTPVAETKPSEASSEKPEPTKTPAEQIKPTATPSKTPEAAKTEIPAVEQPQSSETPRKDGQAEQDPNDKPAQQTAKPAVEESKVTITDVPQTDDITDEPLPFIICMAASAAAILIGIRLFLKPLRYKKPIK